MPKDDELAVAVDYREQLQERGYRHIGLDHKVLEAVSLHIRTVFPGAFDGEALPTEILKTLLLRRGTTKPLTLKELEQLIIKEVSDPTHPLWEMVSDGPTKFDDFLSNAVTSDYRRDVEKSCEDLGFDIRGGVSVGLTNTDTLQAEQHPVFLTDCSVVNITTNLYLLCHRAAKLLAKSMSFAYVEPGAFRLSSNIADYKNFLLNNVELQRQWDSFFADYAYEPNSPRWEVVTLDGEHMQTCFPDLKDAMVLFIMGHEYGHHIGMHSLDGCAGSFVPGSVEQHGKEHEADVVASRIVMNIGRRPDNFNFFASANIGAVCILTLLDMVEKGHVILNSGASCVDQECRSTHPFLGDRLGVIKAYMKHYEYDEESSVLALSLFDLFAELIEFVWSNSRKHLEKMHLSGIRSRGDNDQGWLP